MIVGEQVRIVGERGVYVVRGFGRSKKTGGEWVELQGGPHGHFRAVRPDRVRRLRRGRR